MVGARKPNPAWNRMGPPVPLWFREQLKLIDPDLVLQFIPPRSWVGSRGADERMHPLGVWDVCKVLPRTGNLHSRVTWSLVDTEGRYSPPTSATIRLIRTAYALHRQGNVGRLERILDSSIAAINDARALRSKNDLHKAIRLYCSRFFGRQFHNRITVPGLGVN